MDDNNGTGGYSAMFWIMLVLGIIGVLGFLAVAGGGAP